MFLCVCLLAISLVCQFYLTTASEFHHICPATRDTTNGPPGFCPQDFTIIGPRIEPIHESTTAPTGLALDFQRRLYLTYPRNFGTSPSTVVIATSFTDEEPWPSAEIQNCTANQDSSTCFINVQNVVLDSQGVMWVVDNGIAPGTTAPVPGGPKIMSFDVTSRKLIKTYTIPTPMLENNTNLNDLRINNTLGKAGYAFMTDVSPSPSIVVLDLATGDVSKRLFNTSYTRADNKYVGSFNGEPYYIWNGTHRSFATTGADGIALQSGQVFWGVLASRRVYYAPQAVLANFSLSDDEVYTSVFFPGEVATEQAGFTADDRGRVYISASEQNAIYYVDTHQCEVTEKINDTPPRGTGLVKPEDYVVRTLIRSGQIQHIDSAAILDGYMYFVTNQLELGPHFQYNNTDNRKGPFRSYRLFIGRGPAV